MTQLEQSISDFCAKHDLLSFGMVHHHCGDGAPSYINVTLQWSDPTRDFGRGCAMAGGGSIAEALGGAVAGMVAERAAAGPNTLADEPLPEF